MPVLRGRRKERQTLDELLVAVRDGHGPVLVLRAEPGGTVRHVSIDSGRPYADFRADYETAVPAFDRLEAVGVVRSGAGWSGITALSAATAGHGLVNVFTFDPSPLMKLHGSTRQGVTYLAANIVRAERGFRADPASFLYLPLRIMVSETEQGTGQISFDLPADLMAVFDDPDLTHLSARTLRKPALSARGASGTA